MTKITVEHQVLLRKRVIEARGMEEIREIMDLVRREKFTGSVAINVSQGTTGSVTLEERAHLSLDKQKD